MSDIKSMASDNQSLEKPDDDKEGPELDENIKEIWQK